MRSFGSALKSPIRLSLGDRRLYVVKVDSDRGGRPLSQVVAAVINRQFGRHDMTRHTGLCLLEFLIESLVLMVQLVEIFELYFRLLSHGLGHRFLVAKLHARLYFRFCLRQV